MLDGYRSQQDKQCERTAFVRIQTFMLLRADTRRFLKLLSKEQARGRWMPDTPTDDHTFAGEVAWCDTFKESEFPTVDFVTGQARRRLPASDPRRSLRIMFSVAGKEKIWLPQIPRFDTIDILEQIPCFVPVRDISLANQPETDHVRGSVPAKEIMEFFDLRLAIPTWYTKDRNDIIHSFSSQSGSSFLDSEHYLFFRRDKLDELLKEQKLNMVFVIWGERQHYSERHNSPTGDQRYKYFQNHLLYRQEN